MSIIEMSLCYFLLSAHLRSKHLTCRLVHPWEKNMHLKLHFLAIVKCKEMHLGICVSRLKSLKSSQRYRILVERGAITPYLIKVAVLWTKTVVSLSVIVLGQKFKQITKLYIPSTINTDYRKVASSKTSRSEIHAFSDCLWRGFLIYMYCELLTKSWFPN